jgi:hypothetical protein
MSFGRDIAGGAAAQLFWILVAVFVAGALIALGAYFGMSWLLNHVSITVK